MNDEIRRLNRWFFITNGILLAISVPLVILVLSECL